MVAPKNIVDSYRDLPAETREAIGAYWRNQMAQHAGTPWEDFCRAWSLMIDGDAQGAEAALTRVAASSDAKAVAQARTTLALLNEEDERRASEEYEQAAAHPSATFAMYKRAERLRLENKPGEAEALLKQALARADDGDVPGVQFLAAEYVLLLLALGRREDARELLRQVIEKYPNDLALRRKLKQIE
ncbi:MAG TPA: tetratricopeptide repeat protein [Thermoanaerobaculia bacterium]|nr:tetratricopeptide repeat protein [Thermoanaerobaculia bacterium]